MILQVVGVQRLDSRFDDGKELHGVKLHCVDTETQKKTLAGNMVTTIYIPDDNKYSSYEFALNAEYEIYFAQKSNRIDFLRPVDD